ncbi:MAG: EamA/RhaT family transporter, partial [Formivibrio sp.]|nr:EamA/RhaT family transporter [Formivibrio sp.]
GNILFYVQAHRALPTQPAVVFASMNIGVVVLGTLAGVFAFGERLSWINRAAIALAVAAITLIALGKA